MKFEFTELVRDSFEGKARYAVVSFDEAREIVAAGGYEGHPLGPWAWEVERLIEHEQERRHTKLELVLEDGCPTHLAYCWFSVHQV